MLKKRIIGVVLVYQKVAVQSIGFRKYLPLGKPEIAIEYLNKWGIDEIFVLDMGSSKGDVQKCFDNVKRFSRQCQAPLTFGGGIKSLDDIKYVIQSGADKVSINSYLLADMTILTEGARLFGNQSIVASVDAKKVKPGQYHAFVKSGTVDTGMPLGRYVKQIEECGAGEIFLNSMDNDGMKGGYDVELLKLVTDVVNIPVVICGGAGHPRHLLELFEYDVSGIAAANFFHFSEHSVIVTKSYLKSKNCELRSDIYTSYEGIEFDELGRVKGYEDFKLENTRFKYIPEEII